MHIHIQNKAITVSVTRIVEHSSQHARRQVNRFWDIINKFSNGEWGHPDLNHRNKELIDKNEIGLVIIGIYDDLVVYGVTCWPQLPETKVRILNPIILTRDEAMQRRIIAIELEKLSAPVTQLV